MSISAQLDFGYSVPYSHHKKKLLIITHRSELQQMIAQIVAAYSPVNHRFTLGMLTVTKPKQAISEV